MKSRKNLPVAALRAFEAAARHGRLTAAAEELSVTHGAISRHVSHLEAMLATPLFEGPRNRPVLTTEGRVLGVALTDAFDRMEDAVRLVGKGDDDVLDVACLSTFAMRWLIPRLHDFTGRHPDYDVRLATDDRPPRTKVDVQILVVSPQAMAPENSDLLFCEQLGLVAAPSIAARLLHGGQLKRADGIARLGTRTRLNVWEEWDMLVPDAGPDKTAPLCMFDHYHLTIEAALNGLGVVIAPWHLVASDVQSGRLVAPYGFHDSGYRYVVKTALPRRRKSVQFLEWLLSEMAAFPVPEGQMEPLPIADG